MELDYEKSVKLMLSEFGEEFARTRTLSYKQIFQIMQMLEISLESDNTNWKWLYTVLVS